MPTLIDPAELAQDFAKQEFDARSERRRALKAARSENNEPSAAELATRFLEASVAPPEHPVVSPVKEQAKTSTSLSPTASLDDRIRADFRVFLTLIWRFLLKCDPNPIQLDLAYWLQHGPSRAIIMAFRGFSKSWITGAYALWRLYCDPEEKIMVVSGSLARAIATTNWALSLILNMPLLHHMIPKTNYRQSGQQFDVGSCETIGQSASFSAFGIGGQLVGFRGTCIIPDDVETQTNSLTVVMRDKIVDAVKEFESVLVPGGVIKYLGTPHDIDSLYMKLLRLKDKAGRPVYSARIWCAQYPTVEQIKAYGPYLAPYIMSQIRKLGPECVGHSTMPFRFTDDDLEQRRAAIGNSEFRLQFMLDLSGSFNDKYPLKLHDLTVMALDDQRGPDVVVWGQTNLQRDLQVMGLDGDFYYGPMMADGTVVYKPWERVVGYVDGSGRGADETSLSICAMLYGRIYWLHLWASQDGYSPPTLRAIAEACVRFAVGTLYLESNFGDGMLGALLKPYLIEAWDRRIKAEQKAGNRGFHGGTVLEEVKSGKVAKELRILSVLEPIVQQHRLVVNEAVVRWDYESVMRSSEEGGTETSRYYGWGYQFTHLTRERDCLAHDDRLESLAGAVGVFAPLLGVDPLGMAQRGREQDSEDEVLKLLYADDEALGTSLAPGKGNNRAQAGRPQAR